MQSHLNRVEVVRVWIMHLLVEDLMMLLLLEKMLMVLMMMMDNYHSHLELSHYRIVVVEMGGLPRMLMMFLQLLEMMVMILSVMMMMLLLSNFQK